MSLNTQILNRIMSTCLNAQVTTIKMSTTLLEILKTNYLFYILVDYDIQIINNSFLNSYSGGH